MYTLGRVGGETGCHFLILVGVKRNMITLRQQDFPLYAKDDVVSIHRRIAALLHTLPRYLSFEEGSDAWNRLDRFTSLPPGHDIPVEDLLDAHLVESDASDFKTLPPALQLAVDRGQLDRLEDVDRVAVAYHALLNDPDADESNIFMLIMTVGGLSRPTQELWEMRDATRKRLSDAIEANHRLYLAQMEKEEKFDTTRVTPSSPFVPTMTSVVFHLGPTSVSLVEWFDRLTLSKVVPFAQMGDLYKIERDTVPEIKWLHMPHYYSDAIIFKVDGDGDEDPVVIEGSTIQLESPRLGFHRPVKKSPFPTAVFRIVAGKEPHMELTVTAKVGPLFASADLIRKRLSSCVNRGVWPVHRVTPNGIQGSFFFPYQTVDPTLWAHLCMNHDEFRRFIVVNESIHAHLPPTTGIYFRRLSSSAEGDDGGGGGGGSANDVIAMKTKYVTKPLQVNPTTLHVGEALVHVRVARTDSLDTANEIKIVLGKLMTMYEETVASLRDRLNRWVAETGSKTDLLVEAPLKKKLTARGEEREPVGKLRTVAPEIFLSTYTRKCNHFPTIISPEEAEKTSEKVMVFPIKGEAPSHHYVCRYPHHVYPGLGKNVLANRRLFPAVPCCYIRDPSEKKSSLYRQYFHGDAARQDAMQVQELFLSNKILPSGSSGVLPDVVVKLLNVLEADEESLFVRRGVHRSPFSMIECVLSAQRERALTVEEVQREIPLWRDKMLTPVYAAAALQELYKMTPERIVKDVMKKKDWRVATLLHVIEEAFEINCFAFDRNGLIIPSHRDELLKFAPHQPTVFLFQHWGSESDNAPYPQCEIIVKICHREDDSTVTSVFAPGSKFVSGVFDVFQRMNRSFFSGPIGAQTVLSFLPSLVPHLRHQRVDENGKCRGLTLEMEPGALVDVVVDPLPPFALPTITPSSHPYGDMWPEPQQRVRDRNVLHRFFQKLNLPYAGKRVKRQGEGERREVVTEIITEVQRRDSATARARAVNATFLLTTDDDSPDPLIDGAPSRGEEKFSEDSIHHYHRHHAMRQWLLYDKWVFFLVQYAKYQMSTFLDRRPLTPALMEEFVREKCQVVDGAQRARIEKSIARARPPPHDGDLRLFSRPDGILVSPDSSTLKNLMKLLSLYAADHPDRLRDWSARADRGEWPEAPYQDPHRTLIYHLAQKPQEYVLRGMDAVRTLINQSNDSSLHRTVFHEVRPKLERYFFQHDDIGPEVYVALHTTTLVNANAVVGVWTERGYLMDANEIREATTDADFLSAASWPRNASRLIRYHRGKMKDLPPPYSWGKARVVIMGVVPTEAEEKLYYVVLVPWDIAAS